jgi:hypothetical protein
VMYIEYPNLLKIIIKGKRLKYHGFSRKRLKYHL